MRNFFNGFHVLGSVAHKKVRVVGCPPGFALNGVDDSVRRYGVQSCWFLFYFCVVNML